MDTNACMIIGGLLEKSENERILTNKYTGDVIGKVYEANESQVNLAVQSAKEQFNKIELSPYERYSILLKASQLTREYKEGIAEIMVKESGMTFKDAVGEIERAIQTFILSAEEAKRITGEVLPANANPGMENRIAFTMRVPVGVVCAITPFNAPFNNVVHKVAPAIAAGNTVVLKPSSQTPLSAIKVIEILHEAGLPKKHVNVVFGEAEVGGWLLSNKDINFYTFTGSTKVGEIIKTNSGLRRVALELGNNSATIVAKDVDLDLAVPIIVKAAFRKAGQVCVSLQRIYADSTIANELETRLKEEILKLKVGNPFEKDTDVGPLIDERKARDLENWIKEAKDKGARIVTGGERSGTLFQPTLIADAKQEMKVVCQEVFGPLLSIVKYENIDEAINLVNDSEYGLQAGVFTNDLNLAMKVAKKLDVGGVNINETSNTRFDAMPYGGVKSSGIGREGPKYAIEEMTETKIIQMNLI
ncbi:aldehyde dehydrogenase family protein [Sporosarcina highlanderae]|uniref:Aldehyde dehydrogenase family protein n=1 Tax=Sporosarcina highlanderae TaxID=3035916 RepID=A0ABT8JWD1_9BACL|nr:aldehyde dehydrogenase family protein [Sporosarcina highlanderae]MDN4609172.1 aldehyde dehydrogenase family protein [Sporosarcina highlanderae]